MAAASEPVCLFFARRVCLFLAFYPGFVEQTAERSIEGSGAQPDTPAAQLFNVFQDRVAVTGLPGQAHEDQQHRFGQRRR